LAVEGYFINKQNQLIEFNDKTFAALDDTCGFLRPETAWFWLSFGINLASGVNESFGNENCLWVNGRLYPLSDVLFERLQENRWRIRSLDEKLQLEVETGWRRYENINLRMVGSQFSQWQANVTGQIQLEQGSVIKLNAEYALLEQHYAKW